MDSADNAVKNQVIDLIAKRFIQRPSPPALQTSNGGYRPLRDKEAGTSERFNRAYLARHLDKLQTYGHYLIDEQDQCKLFVIDIDLAQKGYLPTELLDASTATDADYNRWVDSFRYCNDLRAAWHDRSHIGRSYMKRQMRTLANMFTGYVYHYLNIRSASAYSGNKGVHIYGFTGTCKAGTARELAEIVMRVPGYWVPSRGQNFWWDSRYQIFTGASERPNPGFDPEFFTNFSIEVFPKQSSLDGKDLGNLVRLPLGTNLHHPADPTFFIDLASTSLEQLRPVDPIHALTVSDPFSNIGTVNTAL